MRVPIFSGKVIFWTLVGKSKNQWLPIPEIYAGESGIYENVGPTVYLGDSGDGERGKVPLIPWEWGWGGGGGAGWLEHR